MDDRNLTLHEGPTERPRAPCVSVQCAVWRQVRARSGGAMPWDTTMTSAPAGVVRDLVRGGRAGGDRAARVCDQAHPGPTSPSPRGPCAGGGEVGSWGKLRALRRRRAARVRLRTLHRRREAGGIVVVAPLPLARGSGAPARGAGAGAGLRRASEIARHQHRVASARRTWPSSSEHAQLNINSLTWTSNPARKLTAAACDSLQHCWLSPATDTPSRS